MKHKLRDENRRKVNDTNRTPKQEDSLDTPTSLLDEWMCRMDGWMEWEYVEWLRNEMGGVLV